MKVLIVDDEVIIRTGLCTVIDWEQSGFTILEPASSAEEALLRIPLERPEIIFTDIRMTGRSGLDLIREARTDGETEWIVISGYDEFAYAQQAIREGVSEYLLKTSRPDEIIQAAVRAKERLEGRRRRSELGQAKDRLLNRSFLAGLLSGSSALDEQDAQELWSRYPHLKAGQGELLHVWLVAAASGSAGSAMTREELHDTIGSVLSEALPSEWLPWNDCLLLLACSGRDGGGVRAVEQAMKRAESILGCRLFAACGQPVEGADQLPRALNTAASAAGYVWLAGDRRVVDYRDIKDRKGLRGICTREEESALSALLKAGDESALRTWIGDLVERLRTDRQATPDTASAYLHSVLLAGYRWLERATASIGYVRPTAEWEEAGRVTLKQEPGEELILRFKWMMEQYKHMVSDTSPVERAIAYIHEHLEQSLSLAQVARHVHMNPNYFSEVFKRETGRNYIDYVTQAKLKQAMVLLRETPAKISEVAKRIGYEDIKYFNRLFKKFTGMTPSNYRDNY